MSWWKLLLKIFRCVHSVVLFFLPPPWVVIGRFLLPLTYFVGGWRVACSCEEIKCKVWKFLRYTGGFFYNFGESCNKGYLKHSSPTSGGGAVQKRDVKNDGKLVTRKNTRTRCRKVHAVVLADHVVDAQDKKRNM